MKRETMSMKEKQRWYTTFIEEAYKLGNVDQNILQRKQGVVEILRLEAKADPEEAAFAYMRVQKLDQERGGSFEKDLEKRLLLCGISKERFKVTNNCQDTFNARLGPEVFLELKEITNASMEAVMSDDSPSAVMAFLKNNCDRVVEIAEQALKERLEGVVKACRDVCDFLGGLGRAYAQKYVHSVLYPTD